MPRGHETARLGEEQEQDPVDRGKGLRGGRRYIARGASSRTSDRAAQRHERFTDALLQRSAHANALTLRGVDGSLDGRGRSAGRLAPEGTRTTEHPKACETEAVGAATVQIDLQ